MRDNNNGTLTDEMTGIMWQQETTLKVMTWDQAVDYCKGLNLGGYTDWRLPTIEELKSVVDYTRFDPAINVIYFPNIISNPYWSSTTNAYYMKHVWCVHFFHGYDYYYNKDNSYYVIAVRKI